MGCSVFQFANILGNYFITFGTVCSFAEIDFIYDSFIGNILSPCTGREYSLEGYVLHYVVRKRTEFFSEGKLNVRIRPLILQLYSVAALSEIQYKHLTKGGRSVVRCSRFRNLTAFYSEFYGSTNYRYLFSSILISLPDQYSPIILWCGIGMYR